MTQTLPFLYLGAQGDAAPCEPGLLFAVLPEKQTEREETGQLMANLGVGFIASGLRKLLAEV